MACKDPKIEAACRAAVLRVPGHCPNLNTSHDDLIRLYRKVREVEGVKKVMVASACATTSRSAAPNTSRSW